ncbi:unnamed protein product, partial [marine sediment metagenome]
DDLFFQQDFGGEMTTESMRYNSIVSQNVIEHIRDDDFFL